VVLINGNWWVLCEEEEAGLNLVGGSVLTWLKNSGVRTRYFGPQIQEI
jgi:hypothetical protein